MTSEPDWDEITRQNYGYRLFSPDDWYSSARQLAESATLLLPHVVADWAAWRAHMRENAPRPSGVSLTAPFMMLAGMSLECLCKAGIVRRIPYVERRALAARSVLPQDLKGHDTKRFLEALQFPLSLDDEDVVQRLERAVVWSGRYPVPRHWSDIAGKPLSNGQLYNMSALAESDTDTVPLLVNRLATHLHLHPVFRGNAPAGP